MVVLQKTQSLVLILADVVFVEKSDFPIANFPSFFIFNKKAKFRKSFRVTGFNVEGCDFRFLPFTSKARTLPK